MRGVFVSGCVPRVFAILLAASALLLPSAHAKGFPYILDNCGDALVFDEAPQRVLVANTDPLVMLDALDELDKVVAWTGLLSREAFTEEALAKIESIPRLAMQYTATGGAAIGLETVLDVAPDLVLASEKSIDRQMLKNAGIAMFVSPALCLAAAQQLEAPASFDLIFDYLNLYGRIFGVEQRAGHVVAGLKQDLEGVVAGSAERGTGLALYLNPTGIISAYGNRSMLQPMLEAVGIRNVYSHIDKRAFKPTLEDVLAQDPDYLVILYEGMEPEAALDLLGAVPGADQLKAVRSGKVMALPFPFTDPPTPLSIQGVLMLNAMLGEPA